MVLSSHAGKHTAKIMKDLPIERRNEIDNPITLFERFLKEPPESATYHLRVTEWFDEDNINQADAVWKAFLIDYETVISKISSVAGPPHFQGSYEDKGYPEELDWAPYLTYWLYDDRAIFVMCDQSDRETPIVLSIGLKARAEFTPRESEELQW